jgi:hypothetical protein
MDPFCAQMQFSKVGCHLKVLWPIGGTAESLHGQFGLLVTLSDAQAHRIVEAELQAASRTRRGSASEVWCVLV